MKLEKAIKCLDEVNDYLNELASPLGVQRAYPNSEEANYAEEYIGQAIEYLEKLTRETLEELS